MVVGKNGSALDQIALVEMVMCGICLEKALCCGKFCKPLGNIISTQDPCGISLGGMHVKSFQS